jgi:hypothetical protein
MLTEESIWLFGEQAVSVLSRTSSSARPRAQSFTDGGIYLSADRGSSLDQVLIDAGPLGAMRSGHGHADALSVKYSAGGRPCLIDSGTFCYMSSGDERNSFRGTGAHNTLRVDVLDQAVPDGPFAWKYLPTVRAESWIAGETFTYFSGSHTGYLRLGDPVLHRRFVFHLFDNFWMVRDIAEGNAVHVLETFWHLDPSLMARQIDGSFVVANAPDEEPSNSVAFVPVNDSEWDCRIMSGQVSPVYGVAEPAPVLRCRAEIQLPAEHVMLVRTLTAIADAPGELIRIKTQPVEAKAITAYQYRESGRTHCLIFRGHGAKSWKFGDWESDGEFFYFCMEGQRISQLAACQASFIKYHGEALVSSSRPVERTEYWDHDGRRQASSSEHEVLRSFSGAILVSRDAGVVS